jgi:hypothetical protein
LPSRFWGRYAAGRWRLATSSPSSTADDGGLTGACDDYFAAVVACSLFPDAAAAHDAPRFLQVCRTQASLPGSTTTASTYEACARTKQANCSATCQFPVTGTCRICATSIPVGQPCGSTGETTTTCVPGSYCAGSTSKTCVAYGTAGAACSQAGQCQSDLFCSSSHRCVAQGALGMACSVDADQTECSAQLPCVAGGPAGAPKALAHERHPIPLTAYP